MKIGYVKTGEESIVNRYFETYQDYLKGQFPSGLIKNILVVEGSLGWIWTGNYSCMLLVEFLKTNMGKKN